jgi:Tfp pilus assembly protein PilV
MHKSFAKPSSAGRSRFRRGRLQPFRFGDFARDTSALAHRHSGPEDGFLLIEVIISALLVGLIVIATLTGFDVVNRTSADQRRHNDAAVLAAQSQEQLRSDPASALNALATSPHEYTRTVNGTIYTITQEAKHVAASGQTTGCSATQSTAQTGANFQVASTVTWSLQIAAKRPAVKQASIITPPVGSALEVDVGNAPTPTAGVAGVTALVKYAPNESASQVGLQGTTNASGCLIFGGIAATTAMLEIEKKIGYVIPSGAVQVPVKEVTIAPNITTHAAVTYNQGGAIKATFTNEGKTTAQGKTVTGDTFVALNSNIGLSPEFEVGSTRFEYELGAEELYKAAPGVYEATATTPGPANIGGATSATLYPAGDLFPFPSSTWSVYAGDCTKTSVPSEAVASSPPTVEPGKTATVQVPLSYVNLSVLTGNYAGVGHEGVAASELLPVKITSTECASAPTPNNAWGTNYAHNQFLTSQGHLQSPFQPFGTSTLCVAKEASNKTYTYTLKNTAAKGPEPKVYLAQKSATEIATAEATAKTAKEKRVAEEATAKTAKEKRVAEEATAKTAKEKRTKEETEAAAAKTAREKKEKEEREKWKSEEVAKKITKKQREEKEAAQTTARKATEKAETEAKEKRTKEETEATTAKEKRVAEEAAAETAKKQREKEETEATAAAKTLAEEKTKEEANGITVESKSKCS